MLHEASLHEVKHIEAHLHTGYREKYQLDETSSLEWKEQRSYDQLSKSDVNVSKVCEKDGRRRESLHDDDYLNNNLLNGATVVIPEYPKGFQRQDQSSATGDSYYQLAKQEIGKGRKRHSLDLHNLVINQDEKLTKADSSARFLKRNLSWVSVESDRLAKTHYNSERERNPESNRRSSSLSSIPAFFYPDPYSIVVSRYWEELGSLSPCGSEATEYLQLSKAATPEVPVDKKPAHHLLSSHCSEKSGKDQEKTIYNMNFDSALSTSEEYQSFRSSVPLRKICVESDGSKEWKVYDAGPRSVRTPLMFVGPACATADVFYKQILNLTARGIRVISVEAPVYWNIEDWCKGLKKLLDCLNLDKVHMFGASLGGFLAQKFAEYTYQYSRVASLILCNTFLDTSIFDYNDSAMIFWMLPSVILKKLIVENITSSKIMDLDIAHAIEFMIERLNSLSQQELASRMTLNCINSHVDTFKLKPMKMTIMDVFDESALSNQAREDLYQHYVDAKLAHLKNGGNFPYLSRSDDVSMHIMVHLRAFSGTRHTAQTEDGISIGYGSLTPAPSFATPIAGENSHETVDDIFGSTELQSLPVGSVQDTNQSFKEHAASVLGLPVQ